MSAMPPRPPAAAPFNPPPSAPRGKGLAIASLVLGITSFVVWITAIFGLILGIISLAKKRPGKGFAIAGIVCSCLSPLILGILLPYLGNAKDLAKQAKCTMNLNALGKGILMYQAENKNNYPADLNSLIKVEHLPPEWLNCPSATEKGRTCDYVYAPPEINAPLSTTVIACDLAGNHKDVRNVLHVSGSVTRMQEAEFQAALAKPENAAFAAKLRQAESGSGK